MVESKKNYSYSGLEIAVIGMAGRFPGAKNINAFWENLKSGKESIVFFSDEELKSYGVDEELLENPNYIKAKGALEEIEFFDAAFFNYNSREAKNMDPQLRILNECVWTALEDAGYIPDTYPGAIGLYVGSGFNLPWISQFLKKANSPAELFDLSNLNDTNSFATAISYKLDLKGPAVNVNTACSTSLVAIHMACKSLLSGECNMAVAGGVSVSIPSRSGYLYQEGMIFSNDGHCRAFDDKAKGTVNGDGAGIVVLKLLEDARADKDHIYAVIKESAINNDGKRKVGYTAPSVKGQAEVIRTAQRAANIEPESITYIEAHGTGTALGDPVEVEALRQAFNTGHRQFCAIGSVKTNIGHLDSAAGVAGFIKTALALKHKQIPPSLHFETPNSKINFDNTPFYVNRQLRDWTNEQYPLRAGVSSFGIGGTNAHVIMEEAPPVEISEEGSNWKFIPLSARSGTVLQQMTRNLKDHLVADPGLNISDIAYMLQCGRKTFEYKQFFLCRSTQEAIDILSQRNSNTIITSHSGEQEKAIVFMFPGQGSQYLNMGLQLYDSVQAFREEMDTCFDILKLYVNYDLKALLFTGDIELNRTAINQTEITQPLIFTIEYALAKLLIKCGVKPHKMIGHSIGEYVAACLSGVFSLEDALKMVVLRGKLMQQVPEGAMLSVKLSHEKLKLLLNGSLELAAVNSSEFCVVSGSFEAIERLEEQLKENNYDCNRLHCSHAFHSRMMDPILDQFREAICSINWNRPQVPYISNVTGTWITVEQAMDPGYWVQHIRETVYFENGAKELLGDENTVFIEVGPGRTLSSFIKRHEHYKQGQHVINLMRHPQEQVNDNYFLLSRLGQLWLYGAEINWNEYYANEIRYRIPLPAYPFDRKKYWPESIPSGKDIDDAQAERLSKRSDISQWFYSPSWVESQLPPSRNMNEEDIPYSWLVFTNGSSFEKDFLQVLESRGQTVTTVTAGTKFIKNNKCSYVINAEEQEDYKSLIETLIHENSMPDKVLHCWNLRAEEQVTWEISSVNFIQYLGFYSLINLAWAIGTVSVSKSIQINVISNGLNRVTGKEFVNPQQATLLAPLKVIPQEYPHLSCRSIDLDVNGRNENNWLVTELLGELVSGSGELQVAFRENKRWTKTYIPAPIKEPENQDIRYQEQGVYLIVGGFGGIGFTIARHLAHTYSAKLILVSRSSFPARNEWDNWLSDDNSDKSISEKILDIRKMEAQGASLIIFSADVSDQPEMEKVIRIATRHFGNINGIFHCAGLAEGALIQRRTREMSEQVMAPKLKGVAVLENLLKGMEPDFMILFSSLGNILYREKIGQVAYSGANEFFDAYAYYKNATSNTFTVSINWEDWQEVGMSAVSAKNWDNIISPGDRDEVLDNFNLDIAAPGDLESLRFNYLRRKEPEGGEVEIKVEAAALNFKDVLYALGMLPLPEDTSLKFGQECSGVVTAVGKHVKKFKVGDEVIALPGHSCFSSYVVVASDDVALKPPALSFEEAATIPVAFITAYYALVKLGKLKKGDKILIHSAAGGVGLAAVKIARHIGAEIYATAGNDEKMKYLRSLGVNQVMNSRSLQFAAELMEYTGGRGVDVVLNSLSGEFLTRSLEVLAPFGRFLELGLKDIFNNSKLELRHFEKGLSFFAVQIGPDLPEYKKIWQETVLRFQEGMGSLPYKVFQVTEMVQAFEYMTTARHIGKILISLKNEDALFDKILPEGKRLKKPFPKGTRNTSSGSFQRKLQNEGILPSEGILVLNRILSADRPQVLVSPVDLPSLVEAQSNTLQLLFGGMLSNDNKNGSGKDHVLNGNNYEEILTGIFKDFFGLENINPEDNFFEMGATSLDIIQVNNKIGQALKIEMPFVTLYKHQTISALASLLRKDNTSGSKVDTGRSEELKKGKETAQQRLRLRKNLKNI